MATATKTLQDQLYHRDLPLLGRAIGRPVEVAQLKGRANYLCVHRLRRASEFPDALARSARADLRAIGSWAARTHSGDVAEVSAVGEDSPALPLVTSTADNWLGSRCPDIEQCYVVKARRRAAESDLAIVNHHLLLADIALKDDGFGRLLPGADVVGVDEAHRFPVTAQAMFDVTLPGRQVEELGRDAGPGTLMLFFGARNAEELPYFDPLRKLPPDFIDVNFAFSRVPGQPKQYVQDKIRERSADVARLLQDPNCHVYVCGLKGMEQGVDEAFRDACRGAGAQWERLLPELRMPGRYHVETY